MKAITIALLAVMMLGCSTTRNPVKPIAPTRAPGRCLVAPDTLLPVQLDLYSAAGDTAAPASGIPGDWPDRIVSVVATNMHDGVNGQCPVWFGFAIHFENAWYSVLPPIPIGDFAAGATTWDNLHIPDTQFYTSFYVPWQGYRTSKHAADYSPDGHVVLARFRVREMVGGIPPWTCRATIMQDVYAIPERGHDAGPGHYLAASWWSDSAGTFLPVEIPTTLGPGVTISWRGSDAPVIGYPSAGVADADSLRAVTR